MDTTFARDNMLKQQIRTSSVLDPHVLDLLRKVPREAFVPQSYFSVAFADTFIPMGQGQYMLTPTLEGQLLQALRLKKTDKVLEVGTGSGYTTALLGKASQHVYSLDIFPDFIERAHERLERYDLNNCTLIVGNGAQGWSKHQPYDAIAITGSLPVLPSSFKEQLKIGGRLFAVVGTPPIMHAVLITRLNDNQWHTHVAFETNIPPLLETSTLNSFIG